MSKKKKQNKNGRAEEEQEAQVGESMDGRVEEQGEQEADGRGGLKGLTCHQVWRLVCGVFQSVDRLWHTLFNLYGGPDFIDPKTKWYVVYLCEYLGQDLLPRVASAMYDKAAFDEVNDGLIDE